MLAKSTEYAIRSLVYIQLANWNKKRPGVIEIAREIEAPKDFTAKILQILTRHNLVNSMKGRGGGFYFDEGQNITLYNVVHFMEGDQIFNKCGFGLKNCSSRNPCPLHDQYKAVRDMFSEIFNNESIQSMSQKIIDGKGVLNSIAELI